MHIKQITISNFRSFRQQPEIHPFASTTNCVVGRNGSGKSNLFDAVQFVLLSPRFATLRSAAIPHPGCFESIRDAPVEIRHLGGSSLLVRSLTPKGLRQVA